jgi:ABC-type uncharacterized transport system fused permease/ATPase subunit
MNNPAIKKIDKLLLESTNSFYKSKIKKVLNKILKTKWRWKLTKDIEEKFFNRFTNFHKTKEGCVAYDTKKKRQVILRPDSKSFIIVKETGKPCGFLAGAVRASKNHEQL